MTCYNKNFDLLYYQNFFTLLDNIEDKQGNHLNCARIREAPTMNHL